MITFKYESAGTTVTVTTEQPCASDIVDVFRAFLLAAGFQPGTVTEVLGDAP